MTLNGHNGGIEQMNDTLKHNGGIEQMNDTLKHNGV